MKNFLITVCLIFFSFFYNSVIAKNNFVFVDLDMVIKDSIPGTYVLEQLNDLREKNVIDFETKAKLLKENEEKIIKQKNILSSEDFQLKVNDLKIEIKK